MRVPRRKQEKARIEIIPMIDVIFFLLVFFMLSTLAMTVNRGLPVNLPTAATSQKDLRENLNLTLTQDGEIFLNKEPIALQDIGQRVRAALATEPELMVIINADGKVQHSAVAVERSAGHPDLDQAAVEAVSRWRFEPARRGRQPMAVWVLIPVQFSLRR